MRKRLISLLLIIVLIFSNAATVFADNNTHSNTDSDEITTNDSTEVVLEGITTTEDEPNIIDASTLLYRLLIITDNSDIITNGTIISSYDNTYLIGYETEADRQAGYDYYNNIVEFIDYDDNIFEISTEATNTDANEDVDVVNTDDALTNLSTLDKTDIPTSIKKQPIIAVIDSGYNDDDILNSISVVNDDPTDKVGHGSLIIDTILNENPNANIISIKAFEDKKAKPSDIYAAIRYAIDNNVDIINMSFSAFSTEENSIIFDIIQEAIDKNITIIGAAGNNNKNVKYYIPGNIEDAIIIGACDNNYKKIDISNYGDTIDYYVIANSTSEATAIFTGNFSIDNINIDKIISLEDFNNQDTTEEICTETDANIATDTDSDFELAVKYSNLQNGKYYEFHTLANKNGDAKGKLHGLNTGLTTYSRFRFSRWYLTRGKSTPITEQEAYSLPLVCVDEFAGAVDPKDSGTKSKTEAGKTSWVYSTDEEKFYNSNASYVPLNRYTNLSTVFPNNITVGGKSISTVELIKRTAYYLSTNNVHIETVGSFNCGTHNDKGWPDYRLTTSGDNSSLPSYFSTIVFRYILYLYGTDALQYNHRRTNDINSTDPNSVIHLVCADNNNKNKWYSMVNGQKKNIPDLVAYIASDSYKAIYDQRKYSLNPIYFEADRDYFKNTTYVSDEQVQNFLTFEYTTEPTGMIQVLKTDLNGNILKGTNDNSKATFDLYKSDKTTKVATAQTLSTGYAVFKDLPAGTYYVKETKAPSGYQLNSSWSKAITINLSNSYARINQDNTGYVNLGYVYDFTEYRKTVNNAGDIANGAKPDDKNWVADRFYRYAYLDQQGSNDSHSRKGIWNFDVDYYKNNSFGPDEKVGGWNRTRFINHYINNGLMEGRYGVNPSVYTTYAKNTTNDIAVGNNSTSVLYVQSDKPYYDFYLSIEKKANSNNMNGTQYQVLTGNSANSSVLCTFTLDANGKVYSVAKKDTITNITNVNTYTDSSDSNRKYLHFTYTESTISGLYLHESKAVNSNPQNTAYQGIAKLNSGTSNKKILTVDTNSVLDNRTTLVSFTKSASTEWKDYIKNNLNYDLTNTTIKLYKTLTDANAGTNALATITFTDNTGTAYKVSSLSDTTNYRIVNNKLEVLNSAFGSNTSIKLYAKESSAGKGYQLNPNISTLTVTKHGTNKYSFINDIVSDPINVKANKYDINTKNTINTNLGDIRFTAYFYQDDVTDTTIQNKYINGNYDTSKIVKSKIYTVKYNSDTNKYNNLLIDATDFNYSTAKFPMGYLVIRETQAPTGYNTKTIWKYGNDTLTTSTNSDLVIKFVYNSTNDVMTKYIKLSTGAWELINGLSTTELELQANDPWNNPIISTAITTSDTNDYTRVGLLQEDCQVTDTITYSGVPQGIKFLLESQLIDKTNNNTPITLADNTTTILNYITSADLDEHSVDITYNFDSRNLAGHILSSRVKLYTVDENNEIISLVKTHNEDLDDPSETVYFMDGYTSALNTETNSHLMNKANSGNVTIKDVFTFSNVVIDTQTRDYIIDTSVHTRNSDGTDGGILKINNKDIKKNITMSVTSTGEVTAKDENNINYTVTNITKSADNQTISGKINITFDLPADQLETALQGKTTTVFEDITFNDELIFTHKNINNRDQQVHFMSMNTLFSDNTTTDNVAVRQSNDVLTDIIEFTKLPYNTEITLNGVLKDYKTKQDIKINNTSITTSGTFIHKHTDSTIDNKFDGNITKVEITEDDADTKTVSGKIYVTYTLDSTKLGNITAVSFINAKVNNNTVQVASHEKYEDTKETVYYADINTEAKDKNTNTKTTKYGTTTIVDSVTCENLVKGKTYKVSGSIHTKDNNGNDLGILIQNNEEVKKEATIIIAEDGTVTVNNATKGQFVDGDHPNTVSGTIDIEFNIDTTTLGGQSLVVYEDLLFNTTTIAYHRDILDVNQTVYVPISDTTAIDNNTTDNVGTVVDTGNIVIKDIVEVNNLSLGSTYKINGVLMDKKTNSKLVINGNNITSTNTFDISTTGEITPNNNISDIAVDNINKTISFKITMEYTLSSKDLSNKDIVIYETGYYKKDTNTFIEIFKENDINNLKQTIHFPDISTKAIDKSTDSHIGIINTNDNVIENITTYNLMYGKSYEILATLYDGPKDTSLNISKTITVSISDDGQSITAIEKGTTTNIETSNIELNNTNKTLNCTFKVPFIYDSSNISGKYIVVYADIKHNDVTVKSHHDKNDTLEQVHYYKLNIKKVGVDRPIDIKFDVTYNNKSVYFDKLSDGNYNIVTNKTDTSVTTINPDSTGNLIINGFNEGTYKFTEHKTAIKKLLLANAFTVTFTSTSEDNGLLYEFKLSSGGKSVTVEPKDPDNYPDSINITVENTDNVPLNTGGSGTYVFYIISIILLCLAGIIIFIKKKKHLGLFILPICILAFISPIKTVFAEESSDDINWTMEGEDIPVIDDTQKCKLIIDYYDDLDAANPITTAAFTVYKVADMDDYGGFISLIDGIDYSKAAGKEEEYCSDTNIEVVKQQVKPIGTIITNSSGHAELEVEKGLYLVQETKPAQYHVNSTPFLVQLPYIATDNDGNYIANANNYYYWKYEKQVMPKSHPTGNICITKFVKIDDKLITNGQESFHFKISFDAEGEYDYITTAGTKGKIKNGDVILLKSNEYIIISNLPSGCKYEVIEEEANKDGYLTEYVSNTGTIVRFKAIDCKIINKKTTPPSDNPPPKTNDIIYIFIILIIISSLLLIYNRKKYNINV